jgi:hypothetical protein
MRLLRHESRAVRKKKRVQMGRVPLEGREHDTQLKDEE